MRIQGKFVDNLGKIYGLYTGGFIVFIILMAIAEQFGASARAIGLAFVGFTVFIYALIGWLSRTMQVEAYYVAGREVPAVYNGMATAADWMSGASFVALAGGIYFGGYGYLAFVVGWTGGYVLVNSLMAPYLRKFGCYTVPDFIGTRYGGNLARFCLQHSFRGGRVDRPRGHSAVLHAGRHARGDLDPGGPVHRAHHRLPDAGHLDVQRAGLRRHPAFQLR